jgi:hypothetical protein
MIVNVEKIILKITLANFKVLSWHLPRDNMKEAMKTSVRAAISPADTQCGYLPNTSLVHYSYSSLHREFVSLCV